MRTVTFAYPGTDVVYAWLYARGCPWPYACSSGQGGEGFIPGAPPVVARIRADEDGLFRLKLKPFRLPPGDYELHVHEATCRGEPEGAARIPFTTLGAIRIVLRMIRRRKAEASGTTEAPMDVDFAVPGKDKVRVWLFRRDGTLGYDYARGTFEARDGGQSSPLARDESDNRFHFPIAWFGPGRLPDGEYRLDCEGGSKVYFAVRWEAGADPKVTVHGQTFPQDQLEAVAKVAFDGVAAPGVLTKAGVQDALKAFGKATASGPAKAKPEAETKPKPSGPTLEVGGRSIDELAAEKGLNPLTVYARLAEGCTLEQALDAPTRGPHQLRGDRAGRAVELD